MFVERLVGALDDRLGSAEFLRRALKKVFPDHWSFMLGEVCLYAFMALLLTGTYVAFFFNDSDSRVTYHGPYAALEGRTVPSSYDSVLALSLATPAGLLIRQMHHWAALVFIGAIGLHMCRIFFTGAFRKPRELNWVIGVTLLLLGITEGFTGYSLPGDLLSGAGLRIAYSVAESIPVIGTWFGAIFFGGVFPTPVMTQHLFITHVFLLPLVMLGAIGAHLGLVWRQHHTQFRGPFHRETNVVGSSLYPYYAMKSIGLLLVVFAVLAFLGAFFTINPVWAFGPFDPWTIASPSAPDWYLAWLDGSLRLGPAFSIHLGQFTIPPLFFSGIALPGVLFGAIFAWPWIEKRFSPDRQAEHNLLNKPYDVPWRLGVGVFALSVFTILGFASSDDVQARYFHIDVEHLMYVYRWCLLILPALFGILAALIGGELKIRAESAQASQPAQRATVVRNAHGGFEERRWTSDPNDEPASADQPS